MTTLEDAYSIYNESKKFLDKADQDDLNSKDNYALAIKSISLFLNTIKKQIDRSKLSDQEQQMLSAHVFASYFLLFYSVHSSQPFNETKLNKQSSILIREGIFLLESPDFNMTECRKAVENIVSNISIFATGIKIKNNSSQESADAFPNHPFYHQCSYQG